MSDKQLLDLAYASEDRVYYDANSRTMAIAGSSSLSDWLFVDPVMVFGGLQWTQRFDTALAKYEQHKPIRIIGHSLGAEIASGVNDVDPQFERRGGTVVLYGAPRVTWTERRQNVTSYRRVFDLISIFDRAAHTSWPRSINPHDYH